MRNVVIDTRDNLSKFFIKEGVSYVIADNGDIKLSNNSAFTGIPKDCVLIVETDLTQARRNEYKLVGEELVLNEDFVEPEDQEYGQEYQDKVDSIDLDLTTALKNTASSMKLPMPIFKQYVKELNSLLDSNSILNAILSKPSISVDSYTLSWFIDLVEEDQSSQSPKLSEEFALILNSLFAELSRKLN